MWCTPRLDQLWSTLQQCAKSYQSLQQTHGEITAHFEQLIKVIIAQEHRIKTPINDQMSQIQSTINSIMSEIKDITHIVNNFKQQQHDQTREDDDDDAKDVTDLVQSISSFTSINQFMFAHALLNDETQSGTIPPSVMNDDDLLLMISRHFQQMQLTPQNDGTTMSPDIPWHVNADVTKLNNIKKQIESCFALISPAHAASMANVKHEMDGYIMSLRCDEVSLYSLEAAKWTTIKSAFKRSLNGVTTSVVYARGSVYVFGGRKSQTSYSRYSLSEKQCYQAEMTGISGSSMISVCYDGDKHIYLVGGYDEDNGQVLDRVDSFNIDTQEFKQVGHLPVGVTMTCTYFHDDRVHVQASGRLLSFDAHTGNTDVLLPDMGTDSFDPCCFDGVDNMYILAKDSLIKFTLSNKQSIKLAKCPIDRPQGDIHRIIYDTRISSIMYLGGTGKNYQYSIKDEQWVQIPDNDHVGDRCWFGACLIRD
ncbi:hypothetical protein SAMD00019534_089280 [Acytostelium subglobosum LB1]|uniref:hypothetical protein n=1 Tax=Acytostelium subglobosum LB1 TaxID=1410327 RepID=UPI000644E632|nr:hypothetical protein SAMD00019534_089280 [Acytostelium subglobosum LB1]GAM25753.1 hypothetical protein SAMD00019534_089280 [Acytostelium subglobosum LB1]|eukprot:XP_012751271.1 hypothetical protein SAMD00019534_089280 [Acytostelium subglobosum LB1]